MHEKTIILQQSFLYTQWTKFCEILLLKQNMAITKRIYRFGDRRGGKNDAIRASSSQIHQCNFWLCLHGLIVEL